MYQQKDTISCQIVRDKETKTAALQIKTTSKWILYGGTSVEDIDTTSPLLVGKGSGWFPIEINTAVRYYFQLSIDGKDIILSDNHLPMTGGYNFRDMGGIVTSDGKRLQWGKLFRADGLSKLVNEDLKYLSSIPILTIVDFRAPSEMKHEPDRIPYSVRSIHSLSIEAGNLWSDSIDDNQSGIDMRMMRMYQSFVMEESSLNVYKEFFRVIQKEEKIPIIFHCTAGKDRTGMAAALLLYSLGVDSKTIMDDYLLSKVYLENKYAHLIARYPRAEALFTVKPEFLQAGFDQIAKEYGSIDFFLAEILHVDTDRMKELYVS